MRAGRTGILVGAALALGACIPHALLMGFPEPKVSLSAALPLELPYREAAGGLALVTGRVEGKADLDFILDTGAPVSVLIDGRRSAALGLDTRGATPLGDPDNPATPVGVIRRDLRIAFGPLELSGLSAVAIAEKSMPCPERFEAAEFAGVIGADLFRPFVVEIDRGARKVRVHEAATWRPPAGSAIVPFTFRQGHPFVEATITLADGREAGVRLNVDTGMGRALSLVAGSHPAIVMPMEGEVRKSCLVNGTREERLGPPVSVTLGGQRFPVANPAYSAFPHVVDGGRSGTIGIGLFPGRRLFIDYPGRRVVIS